MMKRIRRFHANSRSYLITNSHVSGAKAGELQLFDAAFRAKFMEKLQDYAVFCGVDVFAFSVLPGYFQLLIQVRRPEKLSDDELLSRLGAIYHPLMVDEVRDELEVARSRGENGIAEGIRQRYLRRMWDVSNFMKELLAWISQWVNREKGRTGTLFEDRFRSVVVENDPKIFRMLAAYIELAAVREGLVEQPEQWNWSTGGAVSRGNRFAMAAVRRLIETPGITLDEVKRVFLSWIREIAGEQKSSKEALNSPMTLSEMLRCKCLYFTHGRAIGRWNFYGKLKTDEGEAIDWSEWVSMEGADFQDLFVAKQIAFPLEAMEK